MSLARLVVHLKSNTRQFDSGLQRSTGGVRSWAAATKIAAGVVAVGAAVAYVAIRKITGQMAELDRTAKLASATGFGAGTIAAMGFAAEQTGGDVKLMNKGLQEYSRRMGEAAARGGPVKDTIEQLGLSFRDLEALSPDEQLLRVADAIQRLPSKAAQANAAYQLFGRSGKEMVNLLSQGSDGLKGFIAEANKLGLGFSSEELARVEAANDAINRVKRSVGALWSRVTIAAAPAIEFIAGGLLTVGGVVRSTFGRVKSVATDAWGWVMEKIRPLIPLAQQYKNTWVAAFNAYLGIARSAVRGVLDVFATLWTFVQTGVAAVMGWFGVGFTDMLETGITALAMLEFGFTNWQQVGQLAMLSVGLASVAFFGQIVHFFTGTLPALLTWFGDNWSDIWFSAGDLVMTMMINLGQNIRNVMSGIWEFIKSGGTSSFEVAWEPLTKGFVSTIKELPDIPPRVIGPLESALQKEVDALGGSLGKGMQELVDQRLKGLDDFRNGVNSGLEGIAPPPAPAGDGSDDDAAAAPTGADTGDRGLKTLAQGSAEAYTAIVQAQNSQREAALQASMDAMARHAERSADAMEGVQESFNNATPIGVIDDLNS